MMFAVERNAGFMLSWSSSTSNLCDFRPFNQCKISQKAISRPVVSRVCGIQKFNEVCAKYPILLSCNSALRTNRTNKTNFLIKSVASSNANAPLEEKEDETVPEFQVLARRQSQFSDITAIEISPHSSHPLAGARLLMLDTTGNIHSIYYKDKLWTDSYWEEFAALIPLLPEGPVGVLGLAGGTVVRIILEIWPETQIDAWELDLLVVHVARDYFGIDQWEKPTKEGGILRVHVGDALGADAVVHGGFAGLIVDLFSNGRVIPELQMESTWEDLKSRLRPGGRIIVNCGGPSASGSSPAGKEHLNPGVEACRATLLSMANVFPDEVNVMITGETDVNTLAMTGILPCPHIWASSLPEELQKSAYEWKEYQGVQ